MSERLFADDELTPAASASEAETLDGAVRIETANRSQIELTPTDLETLLPPGHAARLVWRFVEGLDLSSFYATIRARDGRAGRAAIDPKILVALWLYATIDGVGSAREVARLCYAHDAYRWLRGGVSVNYHTLSDFRVGHQTALDGLLTQSITVLLDKQVVTLNRIAQDGMKVRASAGVRSFRRGERLRACQQMAKQQVERTRAQRNGEASARRAAAQRRAADEKAARVDEALAQLPMVEAAKKRNHAKSAARTSTTDPDARIMKRMDGGYRPAYNVQFATDVDGRAVVGVHVTNEGEAAEVLPMLDQVKARVGRDAAALLADGGFVSTEVICETAARGVVFYAPIPKGDHAPGSGQATPHPAVTAWRARMETEEGKRQYKARGATAEWTNADTMTHRGLGRLLVRGLPKVQSWALWAALAVNVLRAMEMIPYQMM